MTIFAEPIMSSLSPTQLAGSQPSYNRGTCGKGLVRSTLAIYVSSMCVGIASSMYRIVYTSISGTKVSYVHMYVLTISSCQRCVLYDNHVIHNLSQNADFLPAAKNH